MTNEEILKKAIEKAVKNGLDWTDGRDGVDQVETVIGGIWFYQGDGTGAYFSNSEVVFSHDFAKAFWKQQGLPTENGEYEWQLRLQDMVIEDDPIKYLEQFL